MSRAIDLTNQRFGRLVAIQSVGSRHGNMYWLCECDCGNTKEIAANSLRRGTTISCGCYHNEVIKDNLIGKKYGRLTVIAEAGRCGSRGVIWKCRCDCGNETNVKEVCLKSGETKSCGCLHREISKQIKTTHGMSRTRLYKEWRNAKTRCENPNTPYYHEYGGRGIKFSSEWDDFVNFRDWAQSNGYDDSLTLDRIDVNGDYEPSNCRWISNAEQQLNKRNNHLLTFKGKTQTLTEWARELGIKERTLSARIIDYKWSIEKALTTPVKEYNRKG